MISKRSLPSGRLAALTVVLLGAAALSGCAAAPAPAAPAASTASEAADDAGSTASTGGNTGADLSPALVRDRDRVASALGALAAGSPSPDRNQLREAFAAAGFPAEAAEVSLDSTPTGLAVDSIRGAVQSEGSCVIGEVRSGQVTVQILPVLQSGFCFVGDQR